MHDDHDRIELEIEIDTDPTSAWNFVAEPGWYINEGSLVEHEISWDGEKATVVDRDHGTFSFRREASDAPRHLLDRAIDPETGDMVRPVEFHIDGDGPVTVRVVESGFATMPVPVEEQVAQFEQNTVTWQQQLTLARERLEG